MIRPWYRSRLFWLGLPGLLFLLWAWLAFTDSVIQWRWSRLFPAAEVCLANGGGQLSVSSASMGGSASSGSPTMPWLFESYGPAKLISLESGQSTGRVFPPWPVRWSSGDPINPDRTSVGIAHWCITLGYVLVWCLAVGLWQRRKARLLNTSVTPPP